MNRASVGRGDRGPRQPLTRSSHLHPPGDSTVTDRPQPTNPAGSTPASSLPASRRDFLKGSTAAATAATLSTGLTVPLVHAAGSGTIKVGLVGCGGRGSGAAEQALTADSNTKLV